MNLHSFEVSSGSITGRDHLGRGEVLVGRNNQDALYYEHTSSALIAVVADGCGSAPYSEVGARLGARLLVRGLSSALAESGAAGSGKEGEGLASPAFWEELRQRMLKKLRLLALQLSGTPEQFETALRDYFLFSLLGAVLTPLQGCVFAIGDGVYALNGVVHQLGPFADNTPPYLAYGLLQTRFSAIPELLRFQIPAVFPADELQTLLIGTDGALDLINAKDKTVPGSAEQAGPISQFWEKDIFFRNPDALRRWLALLNREVRRLDGSPAVLNRQSGLLRDDTTLVVMRRRFVSPIVLAWAQPGKEVRCEVDLPGGPQASV